MSLLQLDNVAKEEGNLKLIDNINLEVKGGQCIGIKCSEDIGLLLFKIICGSVPLSKGTVTVEGTLIKNNKNNLKNLIAVVLKNEGLYERLTIDEYLELFMKLYNFQGSLESIEAKLGLLDLRQCKIKKLTYSQKKRVSFARALVSDAKLILIQEPTLNLDRESISIIREVIPYACSLGISIIAVSVSLEEIIFLQGESYTLDYKGLKPVTLDKEFEGDINSKTSATYKINKIPAKLDEKIILFNPTEIMYIESLEGTSYINVNGEKYPCGMTLSELEGRLKIFGFFRCHRAYLVNLQMVRELVTWTRNSFSIVLDDKNKSSIPLSKGKLNELKDILKL